jgi:hypothetical protein
MTGSIPPENTKMVNICKLRRFNNGADDKKFQSKVEIFAPHGDNCVSVIPRLFPHPVRMTLLE